LNEEVFSKEPFKAGTKDKFVLVEIDFPKKKELDAKLTEQNKALQEQMKVQGFPTIMLCDATGKPYAKTGYQPGGPEKYIESLDKLQAVRVKRDQAFADAEKAKDDAGKAKCLVAGLKTMDDEIVDSCYADVVKKIGELDKKDTTGFVKTRTEAAAKKEAIEKSQGAVQEFFGTKIGPLMQAKEFDKALAEVKSYIKANPGTPEEIQVGMLMNIGLAGPISKKDRKASMAVVDEVAKAYPDSELAKNVDKVKENINAHLDSKPQEEAPEKAPEK
jgi:thioredoxin-related protein